MNRIMITEDYVSYEVAKLLKEKGFDEPCRVFYKDPQAGLYEFKNAPKAYKDKLFEPCFLAPSLYIAMKWLREVHNIHIELNWDKGNQLYSFQIWKPGKFRPEISSLDLWRIYKDDDYLGEWNYEDAVEAACLYALENLI